MNNTVVSKSYAEGSMWRLHIGIEVYTCPNEAVIMYIGETSGDRPAFLFEEQGQLKVKLIPNLPSAFSGIGDEVVTG